MAVLIDANVVLRYLLDDHEELSPKAAQIIEEREAVLLPEAVQANGMKQFIRSAGTASGGFSTVP